MDGQLFGSLSWELDQRVLIPYPTGISWNWCLAESLAVLAKEDFAYLLKPPRPRYLLWRAPPNRKVSFSTSTRMVERQVHCYELMWPPFLGVQSWIATGTQRAAFYLVLKLLASPWEFGRNRIVLVMLSMLETRLHFLVGHCTSRTASLLNL